MEIYALAGLGACCLVLGIPGSMLGAAQWRDTIRLDLARLVVSLIQIICPCQGCRVHLLAIVDGVLSNPFIYP